MQAEQKIQHATRDIPQPGATAAKKPFVPPKLTKHGKVTAVTQQKNPGGSLFPFEQIVAELSP